MPRVWELSFGGSVCPFVMVGKQGPTAPAFFKLQLPRGWELGFGGSVCPFVMNWKAGAYGPCFFNATPKGVGA
jgi:hypothetical protein